MAANQFGRYVWLVDLLRRYGHLTYREINAKWQRSGLSYGEGDLLPLRTFHHHRQAIRDIFNIDIEIDPEEKGYKYHIANLEELEGDGLRNRLLDSYAMLNQVQADSKLKDRILFEEVPSGRRWLSVIIEAMRNGEVLRLTHQSFQSEEPKTFEAEPYYLKMFNRRWYLVARKAHPRSFEKYCAIRIYALDRITECVATEVRFEMNPDFDAEEYFSGCFGIIRSEEQPLKVVLRAFGNFANYLRTLPLHSSQREIGRDGEGVLFQIEVRPAFDLYQALLAQADQLEVLEPASVRDTMAYFARKLGDLYVGKSE